MRRRLLAAGLAAGGGPALLAGCGRTGTGTASSPPPPSAPLPTAVAGPGGTWATVAVGDGGGQAASFWQLLYRPNGSGSWVDDVDATATATNGGIVLAATPTGVLAGVRPSQNLTFSPVVETRTAGRSWIDGVLPGGLSTTPQALAAAPAGAPVGDSPVRSALLGAPGPGQQIVTTASGLTTWTRTATAREVGGTDAGCKLTGLDTIAYMGPTLVAGGPCATPGVVGLFEVGGATPAPIGPPVPPGVAATVLALSPATGHLSALLEWGGPGQLSLSSASSAADLHSWSASSPLALGPATTVDSVTADAGAFLVLADRSGRPELYSVGSGAQGWRRLPAPPAGTATVAPLPGGTLSALTTSGTTVSSWDLLSGASAWVEGQTINVPVLFGSSS